MSVPSSIPSIFRAVGNELHPRNAVTLACIVQPKTEFMTLAREKHFNCYANLIHDYTLRHWIKNPVIGESRFCGFSDGFLEPWRYEKANPGWLILPHYWWLIVVAQNRAGNLSERCDRRSRSTNSVCNDCLRRARSRTISSFSSSR